MTRPGGVHRPADAAECACVWALLSTGLQTLLIPSAGVAPRVKEILSMEQYAHLTLFNFHHNAPATAEMAITLLLSLVRRVSWNEERMRSSLSWQRRPPGACVLPGE